MKFELSKADCFNLAEFIDLFFFQCVREDESIDNIEWAASMLGMYKLFREAAKDNENA